MDYAPQGFAPTNFQYWRRSEQNTQIALIHCEREDAEGPLPVKVIRGLRIEILQLSQQNDKRFPCIMKHPRIPS
ncbi:hypothetical protein TB2_004719 [Malus domestica]